MIWQRVRQNAGRLKAVVARYPYHFTVLILIGGGFLAFRRKLLAATVSIGQSLLARQPDSRLVLVILALALAFVLVIWLVPRWQVGSFYHLPKERFHQVNEARRTLAQILGGLAFLAALYLASVALHTTQEGQVTDRFTRAITQLGDVRLELRLGAIYALERIAKGSEEDHWAVMEILTAYVREHCPRKDSNEKTGEKRSASATQAACQKAGSGLEPSTDIQAALTVLGRRMRGAAPSLELMKTDLRGALLAEARLGGADLRGADLQGADLAEARLGGAKLGGANLVEANLAGATLGAADLRGADLQGADLRWANLTRANLDGANLAEAKLGGASLRAAELQGVDLRRAYLRGADLRWANLAEAKLGGASLAEADFQGADLEGTDLGGADLRQVKNLTAQQLARARTSEITELPRYLQSGPAAQP